MGEWLDRRLAAVMFTDMVGYTALMQADERLGVDKRDRYMSALESHHGAFGGTIVQRLGDGSMSMFPGSLAAVLAAVAIQRELAAQDVPVRIGIHVGEVIVEPERLTGDAVNIAARIESFAVPGGVLLSDSAYEQIRNRSDIGVVGLGRFRLKNVGRPFELYAVSADGVVVPDPDALEGKGERFASLPSNLPDPAASLVGRKRPLARLRGALDRAARGQRTVVAVAGESGIGKTELIRAATANLPLVAWGTCVEGAAAAGYWAWSRALEQLARQLGMSQARRLAGEEASLLATIAPVFGEPLSGEPTARDRLLLFDAVGRWLEAAAAAVAVVVVLDDLHWADDSTVALADFVARSPRPTPLGLIVSYRPDELRRSARAHLNRFASVAEHIQLGGLDRAAVGSLVARVASRASPSTVDEIYRRGGGHPVFTRELALLSTDDDVMAIPGAVRDLIDCRIRRLPKPAQHVLQVAALVGNDVHPDVLATVLGTPQPDIGAACAPALQAGILITGSDGVTRFAHDLYRETLADSIQAAQRPALHQAIGAALENRRTRGGEVSTAELARHFCAAILVDGPDRAAQWALAAAAADRESLAFAEAAGHLRRWRDAVADAGLTPGDDLRIDMLMAEADALARAGSLSDARKLLRAARDLTLRGGAPDRLAKVAVAVAHLGAQFSVRRNDVINGLDQALSAIAGQDPVLEALVSATLARELQHSVAADRPRARPLSERALTLGRDAGEPETLLACLLARHDVLWTPGEGAARAEVAREIVAVAERAGDDECRAEGLLLLANALLEEGSAAYLPTLEACLTLLDRLGQPRHRYLAETRRAALTLLHGDLDEAAARIDAARTLGERIREPDTANVWMSQRLELVRARGHPAELGRFAADAIAHWTGAPVHANAVAAGFLARAGDLDGARLHVATVADLGTWQADRSYLWSVFVRELAAAAAALNDEALCAQLLADLNPLGATCGVNGALVAFAGNHAHIAGLLAAAAGRDGRPLLGRARAVYERLGAAGWLAEVDQELTSGPRESGTRPLPRRSEPGRSHTTASRPQSPTPRVLPTWPCSWQSPARTSKTSTAAGTAQVFISAPLCPEMPDRTGIPKATPAEAPNGQSVVNCDGQLPNASRAYSTGVTIIGSGLAAPASARQAVRQVNRALLRISGTPLPRRRSPVSTSVYTLRVDGLPADAPSGRPAIEQLPGLGQLQGPCGGAGSAVRGSLSRRHAARATRTGDLRVLPPRRYRSNSLTCE